MERQAREPLKHALCIYSKCSAGPGPMQVVVSTARLLELFALGVQPEKSLVNPPGISASLLLSEAQAQKAGPQAPPAQATGPAFALTIPCRLAPGLGPASPALPPCELLQGPRPGCCAQVVWGASLVPARMHVHAHERPL